MKNISKKTIFRAMLFITFAVFIAVSFIIDYQPGKSINKNFVNYSISMLKVVPFVFILIGLFDVWVDKKTIQKHLGEGGGIKSYFWVFALAAPMGGGLLPAMPIAYELYKKGARYPVVLTFLGAVSVGRVPMILLESGFLGYKFSIIRLIVAIPLVIATSVVVGKHFDRTGYKLPEDRR